MGTARPDFAALNPGSSSPGANRGLTMTSALLLERNYKIDEQHLSVGIHNNSNHRLYRSGDVLILPC
jgi:hypothetical protein